MKFACFEKTVVALYTYVVPKPRDQCSKVRHLNGFILKSFSEFCDSNHKTSYMVERSSWLWTIPSLTLGVRVRVKVNFCEFQISGRNSSLSLHLLFSPNNWWLPSPPVTSLVSSAPSSPTQPTTSSPSSTRTQAPLPARVSIFIWFWRSRFIDESNDFLLEIELSDFALKAKIYIFDNSRFNLCTI